MAIFIRIGPTVWLHIAVTETQTDYVDRPHPMLKYSSYVMTEYKKTAINLINLNDLATLQATSCSGMLECAILDWMQIC